MTFLFKCDLHHTFIMRKYGFVTVTEIEPPDLDVLIGGRSHNKLRVVGYIHGENG